MVTSKSKKAKGKRTKKAATRSRKAVSAKRARKGAKKVSASTVKATTAAAPELHPRLREQSLRSERSTFPDDFHALYDRDSEQRAE